MQCAARSSGRVRLNDPRNDLASAVRELATMTASLMKSPICFSRAAGIAPRERRAKLGRHSGGLGGGSLLFIELGECLALRRQTLQKRSRLPEFPKLLVKFRNPLIDL